LEIYSIDDENIHNVMYGETAYAKDKISTNVKYILDYVRSEEVEAGFIVVEDDYVDRDFCVDYSKYYSSTHTHVSRVCRRIHFFKKPQLRDFKGPVKSSEVVRSSATLKRLFKSPSGTEKLQKLYCGFTVIDGIYKDKYGRSKGHVGRTVLRTYCGDENECKKEGNKKRSVFHTYKQKVSLFGHELTIDSLPFTSKDEDVGMCATAALWVAQFPLMERHGGDRFSQYEITDIASKIELGEERRFPDGLSDRQMNGFLQKRGYEVERLSVRENNGTTIVAAIKTFVDAKIPIIATLSMREREKCARKICADFDDDHKDDHRCEDYAKIRNDDELDGHAVVITGYSLDVEGKMDGIYVHDDNFGPYARVKFNDGKVNVWEYKKEKEEYGDCCLVSLDALTFPIYPKIKLPYLSVLKESNTIQKNYFKDAPYEIILIEGKKYKKEILCKNDLFDLKNKSLVTQKILEMKMPRYIWVVRFNYEKKTLDILLDSTSIERKSIATLCLENKSTRMRS